MQRLVNIMYCVARQTTVANLGGIEAIPPALTDNQNCPKNDILDINILKNVQLGTVPESVIIFRDQFLC